MRRVDDVCGTHVQFRLSETPCFFPKALIDRMARGREGVDSAVGGQSRVSREVGGGGSGGVQGAERAGASDVCAGGFWAGAGCARRVAAEAGGVAGLPFSLRVSGAAGAGYIECTGWSGLLGFRLPSRPERLKYFLERAGDCFLSRTFAAGDCGGARSGECDFDGDSSGRSRRRCRIFC